MCIPFAALKKLQSVVCRLMFAEKKAMSQCIVNIVGQVVYITFNQIVAVGTVEVWESDRRKDPVLKTAFEKTNFINIKLPQVKARYHLEIAVDGEHISRIININ